MNEQLTTLEQATALKSAGFDWPTITVWHNHITLGWIEDELIDPLPNSKNLSFVISRPTLDMAVRWLREVKGLHVAVTPTLNWSMWFCHLHSREDVGWQTIFLDDEQRKSHDAAISAGVSEALKKLNA